MPVTRRRSSRRSVTHAALLASASFMSLTFATEAQAQCVTSPAQPLNNVAVNGSTVNCTGANTGQTITVTANDVLVTLGGPGSTLDNTTLTLSGDGNEADLLGGFVTNLVFNGSSSSPTGNGTRLFVANGTNLTATLNGPGSINMRAGTITATPGNINLSSTTGIGIGFNTLVGNILVASGNNGGAFLLTGGAGSQFLSLNGTMTVQANGLAIATGDGEDLIVVGATAVFNGGTGNNILFDGGTGLDRVTLAGGGAWDVNTINIEALDVNAGANNTRFLNGTGDYTSVRINTGAASVTNLSALGQSNSFVTIGSGATLILALGGNANANNNFAGSGTITQAGQTVTYGGDGSGFAGTFRIGSGTAIITSSNAFGIGTIENNAVLSFGGFDLTNDISGTGQVIVTGNGTAFLSGTNTFSGGLDVQGGLLEVGSVVSLGSGNITSSNGAGALVVRNNANEVLTNNIVGNIGFVKAGTGTLDLTGTNTYAFGTLIQEGAVRVDSFARLGTGVVVANQGASLILNYNGAGQLLQTTPFLLGDGSFIKEGTGDVVMTLASSFTGGTIIREGRVGLNNGGALGTGAIQIDAGAELGVGGIILNNDLTGSGLVRKTASNTVELYGDNSGFTGTIRVEDGDMLVTNGNALGSGTLQIDSGTVVYINAGADSVMAAGLTGAGNFEKAGAGRVTLTGNGAQFGGGIAIQNGTLQIAGDQNIGTSAGGVFINTLGTLAIDTSGNTNLATVIYGSGNVVKTGAGTVFMTGANTYSGGTEIQQGAIRVTDVAVLGTGAITVQQGAALDLSIAGAQTLSQNVTGAGILRKSDAGDLTLLGNGLTGGVDIVGGRVIVSTASALGGGPVTTAAGTRLVYDNTATEVSNTAISGAGGLTKNGTGLLVMNNANSFTGGTVINAGRVGLNDGMGLGTGNIVVNQGAILGIGGVNLANNVSGAGQIIKTANNTGILTGTNTHSGGIDIQQGNVAVNSPAALGTGAVMTASGTALIVDYNGANSAGLANTITGSGMLVKEGTGTLAVNGTGNNYVGGTAINGGRLVAGTASALGTGGVSVNSGAVLEIGAITFANNVSGAGRIVKTGSGAGALTGTNTHSGGIGIEGGSLAVSSNSALGTGAVSIASGASLNYTNAAAATFSNGLSGAGAFTKLGAGQLSFANNFTIGALNLNAGRTRINTVATTNATVASGATLDGTGRIIGNLVNNGTVAPGNSIGTLTVQGNYTHNAGSVLEIEFDANGNIDLLDVTGNAVLNGGTLRFVGLGGAEGQGGTFLRTGGSLTGTFTTVETVGALLPLAVFYQANAALMAPSVLTARPSTFNAQSLAAADTALGFIDSIGLGDARHGHGSRLWLSGFGAWGSRSASGATLAYDHDTRGISGGVNVDVGGGFTLGAAVGWAEGDITLGSNGGGGDQTHTLGSATLRYAADGFTLGGGVVLGSVDQSTLRNVSFNGFSGSVSGATESSIFGMFAEAGVPLGAVGGWNFGLNARGSVVRQEQDAYTESGVSPLRLQLDNLATETVEGQARLTAKTRLWDASRGQEEDASGLDLRIDLGGRYLGLQGDREIPVLFAVSNAGIVLQGDTRDTVQGIGGVALDYTTNGGATFSLGYRGEIGKTDRHAVQAGLSIAF